MVVIALPVEENASLTRSAKAGTGQDLVLHSGPTSVLARVKIGRLIKK